MKWAGGKERELKHILPLVPPFEDYFEPFVGGGAVFFALHARRKFINDKSHDLYQLYLMVARQEPAFFATLESLQRCSQIITHLVDTCATTLVSIYSRYSQGYTTQEQLQLRILGFVTEHTAELTAMFDDFFSEKVDHFFKELHRSLFNKTRRMKVLEGRKSPLSEPDILDNLESALRSALYTHVRHLHNHTQQYEIPTEVAAALFFFIRENAYSSMFRYNRRGEFNAPYGGISYNRKNLGRKIAYMRSPELLHHFEHTVIENMDFETFLDTYQPTANDFIFLDPPYDSVFSTYTGNEFGMDDQRRLASYLLERCPAMFMLVIKETAAITQLYDNPDLNIRRFDKTYRVSFQDRNKKQAQHLIITNF